MTNPEKKIGLIAGGGLLPTSIVEKLREEGISFHVVSFKGQPKPTGEIEAEYHTEVNLGAVGKVLKTFKKQGVTHVVMAGFLSKPSLFDVRPDLTGLKILASLSHKHDDALLSAICDYFEGQGFGVLGAHDLVPDLVAKIGVYGKVQPTNPQKEDIKLAVKAALTLGSLDIGQSVIVKNGVVLGVEGAEGTDGLLDRCASLRGKENSGGLLVKCAKPHQNLNVDMPSIGVETIEKLAKYSYDGVAVLADKSLILDVEGTIKNADKNKVFLLGVGENGEI